MPEAIQCNEILDVLVFPFITYLYQMTSTKEEKTQIQKAV